MYQYEIEVLRVLDGDTVDVMVDLGFHIWHTCRLRLYGIDAPETRTRDLTEKEAGFRAKDELIRILADAKENGNRIWINSHGLGKFGRVLATIYVDDLNVNDYLITENFVNEYNL